MIFIVSHSGRRTDIYVVAYDKYSMKLRVVLVERMSSLLSSVHAIMIFLFRLINERRWFCCVVVDIESTPIWHPILWKFRAESLFMWSMTRCQFQHNYPICSFHSKQQTSCFMDDTWLVWYTLHPVKQKNLNKKSILLFLFKTDCRKAEGKPSHECSCSTFFDSNGEDSHQNKSMNEKISSISVSNCH